MIVFYNSDIHNENIVLTPEESKHCVKALRQKEGDHIFLTDGKGTLAESEITVATPTQCVVQIIERKQVPPRTIRLHIAVAPTKNMDRIEWFVEKAVEIGIEKISLLICEHSERTRVDLERLHRITIAALKQSQTARLPELQVIPFQDFMVQISENEYQKYIAWCDDTNVKQLAHEPLTAGTVLVLIGPEGDFSEMEIAEAKALHFKEIKLGDRRLRTETAALYSCCAVAMQNLSI